MAWGSIGLRDVLLAAIFVVVCFQHYEHHATEPAARRAVVVSRRLREQTRVNINARQSSAGPESLEDEDGDGEPAPTAEPAKENPQSTEDRRALWDHKCTGRPGGIGRPNDEGAVPLYHLDREAFQVHQDQFHNRRNDTIAWTIPFNITGADGQVEEDQFLFPTEAFENLPEKDHHWNFATCAIVSNSGRMLDGHLGAEIDAHEAVFRINHARLLVYQESVGHRTTFDVNNRPHVKALSKINHRNPRVLRPGYNSTMIVFESTVSRVYVRFWRHLFQQFPYPGVINVSPGLSSSILKTWRVLALRWPDLARSSSAMSANATNNDNRCRLLKRECEDDLCKPSTGFHTLMIAAQVCNNITMYGFEDSRNAQEGRMVHYFDSEEATTAVHSFDLMMNIFKYLSEQYPIRVVTPGLDGNSTSSKAPPPAQ